MDSMRFVVVLIALNLLFIAKYAGENSAANTDRGLASLVKLELK